MNKTLTSIFSIFLVSFCTIQIFGQVDIRIRLTDVPCDSVRIQSYNWEKKSGTDWAMPYSSEIIFKDKKPLKPGMYWLSADSNKIALFIVSAEKKQKLSFQISNGSITFEDNPENTHYQEYVKQMNLFDSQMDALNNEFQSSRNLPSYMLQTLADSLTARARRITQQRTTYEQKVIHENPHTLLASIVAMNIPIDEMPPSYYGNQMMAQQYIIEHFFDHFPWTDSRIFNTPIAENKFKEYCNLIYQWDRPDLDTFVVKALQAAKINDSSYLHFYDRLERTLGFYMSDYKVEHTYIKLLQEILTCPKLEEKRRVYYEHELSTINKNLSGDYAPNFRFVNEKGDTTDLYSFNSEYTLLFLHNPTCHTCQMVRNRIAQYGALNRAIESGRFNVLTIYLENDESIWSRYLRTEAAKNYHHGWNFDLSIEEQSLYETRTIPYMFLLDKDKRIIRKNILVNEIEEYINYLNINK